MLQLEKKTKNEIAAIIMMHHHLMLLNIAEILSNIDIRYDLPLTIDIIRSNALIKKILDDFTIELFEV